MRIGKENAGASPRSSAVSLYGHHAHSGNYQEHGADKVKRLGEEGAKPKRIRYKPLRV
jgi:hypothetical protein